MRFKKLKLANGIRLILAPMSETKAVTILVLAKVGSRHEDSKIAGTSHFIEHMMFKGTRKRPTTLAISKELDGVGAEYNAFTAKDHTGYYIKIDSEKVKLALDILSDVIFNSKFDEEEIKREKQVISEEINMYEDNPLLFVEELFEQIIFKNSSLGRLISGSKETVNGLNRSGIVNYYDNYYQPSNLLIGVAGNFDNSILKSIKYYFCKSGIKRVPPKFKKIKINQKKPQINLKYKKTEQIQICLGFPGYSYFDKRIYALYILGVILGGNMSSRLFIKIRERMGLAYFIRSSINIYQDIGNFYIQAGLDKSRIEQAINEILKELTKIKKEGVVAEELRKAKDFLKGKLKLELESSESIVSWFSKQELLMNKIISPNEQIKRLEKVTVNQVKKVASQIFKKNLINLALISPYKDKERFLKLLKFD